MTLTLPIDNEKTGKPYVCKFEGGRNEALHNVCLEACKILDKKGVLRSDTSAKKLISRDWHSNEYYDSDEDEFLDRTDDLQRKRKRRQERLGDKKYKDLGVEDDFMDGLSAVNQTVENDNDDDEEPTTKPGFLFSKSKTKKSARSTFQSLKQAKLKNAKIQIPKIFSHNEILDKLKLIAVEIYKIEKIFTTDKNQRKVLDDQKSNTEDSLDVFMKHVKSGTAISVAKRLELRGKLTKLRAERQNYLNLELAARPSNFKEMGLLDFEEQARNVVDQISEEKIKKELSLGMGLVFFVLLRGVKFKHRS